MAAIQSTLCGQIRRTNELTTLNKRRDRTSQVHSDCVSVRCERHGERRARAAAGNTAVAQAQYLVIDKHFDFARQSAKDHALTLEAAGSPFQELRLSEMVLNDCLASWMRMAYPIISRCTRAASFCSVSRNMCSSAISLAISCTEVPDTCCTSEPT